MRPVRLALIAGFAALALAGCGGSEPTAAPQSTNATLPPTAAPTTAPVPGTPTATPSPGPVPSGGIPDISLVRSGGIAGGSEMINVTPAGEWTRTSQRGTKRQVRSGKLTPAERDRVRELAIDPQLLREPGGGGAKQPCADGYQYKLSVGGTPRVWTACGGSEAPKLASELAAILMKAAGA